MIANLSTITIQERNKQIFLGPSHLITLVFLSDYVIRRKLLLGKIVYRSEYHFLVVFKKKRATGNFCQFFQLILGMYVTLPMKKLIQYLVISMGNSGTWWFCNLVIVIIVFIKPLQEKAIHAEKTQVLISVST